MITDRINVELTDNAGNSWNVTSSSMDGYYDGSSGGASGVPSHHCKHTVQVGTLTTPRFPSVPSLLDGAGNLTRNQAMMHTQDTTGDTTAHHGNGVTGHLLKDCLVTTTSVLTWDTEHLLVQASRLTMPSSTCLD